MSTKWSPDDSVIEGEAGKTRIREALERHNIRIGDDRVVTSRDPGMDDVRYALMRPGLPPGFIQWQLPIKLTGETFFFTTVCEPGAVVPTHSHKRDLFRIVVSGSIITNGIELKAGDWMFVPAGVEYSFSAALNPGAIINHCYG